MHTREAILLAAVFGDCNYTAFTKSELANLFVVVVVVVVVVVEILQRKWLWHWS